MKTFDERLIESLEVEPSPIKALVKAAARFRDDRKQPDPLQKWKALKEGDKVLNIESKSVLTVGFPTIPGGILLVEEGNGCGYEWDVFPYQDYQILPSGPFDAAKCYVGMWVWVEKNDTPQVRKVGWTRITEIEANDFAVDGWWYTQEGIFRTAHANPARLHFSPPEPVKSPALPDEAMIAKMAEDDEFCKWAVVNINNEDLVPYPSMSGCDCMGKDSWCWRYFGTISSREDRNNNGCPCRVFGPSAVRSVLRAVIAKRMAGEGGRR